MEAVGRGLGEEGVAREHLGLLWMSPVRGSRGGSGAIPAVVRPFERRPREVLLFGDLAEAKEAPAAVVHPGVLVAVAGGFIPPTHVAPLHPGDTCIEEVKRLVSPLKAATAEAAR